jgi:hypothetical protein
MVVVLCRSAVPIGLTLRRVSRPAIRHDRRRYLAIFNVDVFSALSVLAGAAMSSTTGPSPRARRSAAVLRLLGGSFCIVVTAFSASDTGLSMPGGT